MKRRSFFQAAAALPALAVAARAQAAANACRVPDRFALGWHSGVPGTAWTAADCRASTSTAPLLQVRQLGVQGANVAAHPLRRLDVELLYHAAGNAAPLPYRWAHLSRGDLYAASRGTAALQLDAARTAGLRLTYAYADANGDVVEQQQSLAWIDGVQPLLTPGYYALVGPSAATGRPPAWSRLASPTAGACAIGRCDALPADFDTVLIAVEAIASQA